jgi:hypothetical protein
MFDRCTALLRDYSEKVRRAGADDETLEYLIEFEQRLAQLAFIVNRVRALAQRTAATDRLAVAQYNQHTTGAPLLLRPENASMAREARPFLETLAPARMHELEMRVLTEAFYYIGFRASAVAQKRLPGLGGFAAEGVRNKLIEHPEEKEPGVIENGYSFDHNSARGLATRP